jgi:hypothetical protein
MLPSHKNSYERKCGCLLQLGSVASWHGNNSQVLAHACKHTMEFSRTPLRSLTSMHQSLTQLQDGVLRMQYHKQELDCGYSRHQPVFLLVCFVSLLCCYLSLDNFYHLDWRCKHLFIFFNLHSPHPSLGCVVSRVKLWMKSPTLCFPMTTQIAVVEKVLVVATRTS